MLPVLFLIPARAGSRRIPGKNLRTVAGIPLVAHAVRLARRAAAEVPGGPHRVVCSTDDPAIAAVAERWHAGPSIMRPPGLSTDTATSADVAVHALDALAAAGHHFRAIVLVQPTSPLTDPADLIAAVERSDATGRSVTSVTSSHPAAWHQRVGGPDPQALSPIDGDAPLLLTGAFYVIAPDELRATGRFVVPDRTTGMDVPPPRSVDIDEPFDLLVAEAFAAARPVRHVPFGDRVIGSGPLLVIAEAGVNHDGDPAIAHRLIDAAVDAAADVVKFQTFDPAQLATGDAPLAEYQRRGEVGDGSQRSMLERYALEPEVWAALQRHALDRGIQFLSSPFDEGSANLLDRLDVAAFKVPSGELTNLPFLRVLASKRRPLLISTGMADIAEVADALDAIAAAGDPPVALFHCVSNYPADPATANLRAMGTLRAAFGVPVGWSDHSLGIELAGAATALGAELLEKHLTLDRSRPGPDHRASLEPDAFAAMVSAVRAVEAARGDGDKRPAAEETAIAAVARKSLFWARALEAGEVVSATDVRALRPGTGVSPARLDELIGRPLVRAVRAGEALALTDVEETT